MNQNLSTQSTNKSTPFGRLRRDFLLVMATISLVMAFGGAAAQFVVSLTDPISLFGLLAVGGLAALSLAVFVIGQSGQIQQATNLLLLTLTVAFAAPMPSELILVLLAALLLTVSAVLATPWIFRAILLLIVGKYALLLAQIILDTGITSTPQGNRFVIELATLLLVGITMRFFIYTLERSANESTRNAALLAATAEIGQTTSRLMNLDELFGQTAELIREKLDYYHVQIFMLATENDTQYANLVASTGRAGRDLLNRGYRVAVGAESVIGRVTLLGEPMIVYDTDLHTSETRAELMASTRSEMAVPILDGEQIIGALDVQSVSRHAFSQVDVRALQVIANQIGNAIRNAQLFQAQQVNVEENRRLLAESEASLEEIQRLNRRLTSEAWGHYLAQQPSVPGITIQRGAAQHEATWTPAMLEASQRQQPVATGDNNGTIAVPLLLRGEVIGALEIAPGQATSQADALGLAQDVARRLAISLENARLIDEAQEMHPRVMSELRILSSTRFDSRSLLSVVLAGDGRLLNKLRCEELLPLGSRVRTRLVMEAASREELVACLNHLMRSAGNPKLMTRPLVDALAEHAMGNYRAMTIMAADLFAVA
ncbi:MAG: GAF domain-containing protein, partial [Phototrophicaceae bacterium]